MSKNKKNILSKFIIIFIIVCLSFYVYTEFFSMRYNNVNNTRWLILNEILKKNYDLTDSSIQVLFVGDSRLNAALDYTKIKNSWSFGLGGATPIEIYYLIKKYDIVYDLPDTVYFSISPRFLTEYFAFWDLAVRNDFFSFEEIKEIKINSKRLNDESLSSVLILRYLLYKINFPNFYQEDLRNNLIFFGYEDNAELIDFVLNNRGKRPHPDLKDSCCMLNYETKMKNFAPSAIYDFYFDEILNFCLQNKVMCIFFAMPMNESSFRKLDNNFIAEYQKYMQEKQKAYPDFLISDSLYCLPDSFFGDESHLNQKGTDYFTNLFNNNSSVYFEVIR